MLNTKPIAFALVVLLSSCTKNREEIETLVKTMRAQQLLDAPLPPKPFVSDGCSCLPGGNWVACWVQHDYHYWQGGTRRDRKTADGDFASVYGRLKQSQLEHLDLLRCAWRGHLVAADPFQVGIRVEVSPIRATGDCVLNIHRA